MRFVLAIVLVSLLSINATAATTEVATPAETMYVVDDGDLSVWWETNGMEGLQTEAVRDAAGAVIAPPDQRVIEDATLTPYSSGCIDMPHPNPPYCPVEDLVGIAWGLVEEVRDTVFPIEISRPPMCVYLPQGWNPPQVCV